jgi:hypothetical protein
MAALINSLNFSVPIIVKENLIVLVALLAHDGSTNLTESDTVSPALTVQAEALGSLFHIEG